MQVEAKTQFTLFVGTEYDKDGNRITDAERAQYAREVFGEMADRFGGYSVNEVEGGWFNENGELVTEKSLRFESLTGHSEMDLQELRELAQWVKEIYRQEAVLLNCTVVNSLFV